MRDHEEASKIPPRKKRRYLAPYLIRKPREPRHSTLDGLMSCGEVFKGRRSRLTRPVLVGILPPGGGSNSLASRWPGSSRRIACKSDQINQRSKTSLHII